MEGHAGQRITRTKVWSHEQTWPLGIILNNCYDWSSRCPWKIAEHETGKAGKGIEQGRSFHRMWNRFYVPAFQQL